MEALNPCEQQREEYLVHRLFPDTMSLKITAACFEYKKGFRNPITGFPPANRAELINENIPAITGDEAEVPEARVIVRFATIM